MTREPSGGSEVSAPPVTLYWHDEDTFDAVIDRRLRQKSPTAVDSLEEPERSMWLKAKALEDQRQRVTARASAMRRQRVTDETVR